MKQRQYFGTDGIRGRVGSPPITAEFALRLGYAVGRVLVAHSNHRVAHPAVLIGKDTRSSGYMLESALESGLSAAGVDVYLTGPLPTPGVAYLTRALRLAAGMVISASHNAFEDNGIKFFAADGSKLDDDIELLIEQALEQPIVYTATAQLGKAWRVDDATGRYIEFCKSSFPNDLDLRGYKLVVDCAHGAAYQIAPHVFHELGAEVVVMGNQPNGININENVGATMPQKLRQRVLAEQADLGIALDGDGDRLIMVDRDGDYYDGDRLLYVIAKFRYLKQSLRGGIVGTAMSNLGLEHAFAQWKVPFERAKVGDRYVLALLKQRGWLLGGEGSGHLLCLDKHSTGDGIISALQVLAALRLMGQTLTEFTADLTVYPQQLHSVKVKRDFNYQTSVPIRAAVDAANAELAGKGRVLLRPSGTEPVLRVMVESEDPELTAYWASYLVSVVETAASY